jgi:DNA-binding transcriptional LysR family regulator
LVNDGEGMVAAALMALGLSQVPNYMVTHEMRGGLLANAVVPRSPMPISAVTPSSGLMPPREKVVQETLEVLRERSA